LHHKILLIDYTEAIVGGINVFHSGIPGYKSITLDFAVYLKGPIIKDISIYCQSILKKSCDKTYVINNSKEYLPIKNGYQAGISVNDWIHGRSTITKQYSHLTTTAQNSIVIINSYFFPRKKFMKQLIIAAKRGVKVRLILPKYSDWASYVLASEYLYSHLLNSGVEIYLWEKSVLHGKLATVDNQFTTLGSFNLNYTSYQQNLEMNVDIYSKEFTTNINKIITNIIDSGCVKLDPLTFDPKASFKIRFYRWFFYIILATIANFSVGMSFQERSAENRFLSIFRIIGAMLCFILGIIGLILPIMPGFIFFVIGFLLIYDQILHNKKVGD
jgi:cardiolipin synthase